MQYQNLMINMAKKIKDIKLADFPEEVDENGLKWYGEMSYETLIAVLSHHLHTGKKKFTAKEKRGDYLCREGVFGEEKISAEGRGGDDELHGKYV